MRRSNQKGHIETHIAFAQLKSLVLVPVASGVPTLNANLNRRRREDLAWRDWGKPPTNADRLDEERSASLSPLVEAFVAARVGARRANSLVSAKFEGR